MIDVLHLDGLGGQPGVVPKLELPLAEVDAVRVDDGSKIIDQGP